MNDFEQIVQRLKYSHNEMPKCPHCDEDIEILRNDLYEILQEGSHDIMCPFCDKSFVVNSTAIWAFSTEKHK